MKTAIVTGGSRGIGRACAEALARAGYTVFILYEKNDAAAEETLSRVRTAGGSGYAIRCDVADENAVNDAVAHIVSLTHRVDVLVNNAGFANVGLFSDTDPALWQRMMNVHVNGAYYLCRAVLPLMRERDGGSIINISSMWGQVGASCEVAYSTAKAALIGFTKALSKEVGLSGIRVNCVCPGVIDTDMNACLTEDTMADLAEQTPLGRIGTADEVARTVLFLAGEDASFITGQVLGVNGGLV